MATQTKLYRITEAAQILGVRPKTLRKMGDTGEILVTRRPGGQRYYDVEGYLSERAIAAAGEDARTFFQAARYLELPESLFERLVNEVAPAATPPRRRVYTVNWLETKVVDARKLRAAGFRSNPSPTAQHHLRAVI